jgi:hypothetical protein
VKNRDTVLKFQINAVIEKAEQFIDLDAADAQQRLGGHVKCSSANRRT